VPKLPSEGEGGPFEILLLHQRGRKGSKRAIDTGDRFVSGHHYKSMVDTYPVNRKIIHTGA
jgi:hypothetical protein